LFPAKSASSDSNLRSHLGHIHKLEEFLYPSQRNQKPLKEQKISFQHENNLDSAAINAIIQDSHIFNLFRKPGMKKFLSLATPGYRGPNRRTVVKRLKSMYKQRRSSIRQELSIVSDIALSVDLWQSVRRAHFICLSAHYYDKHYKPHFSIISFRRFIGTHSGDRLEDFIINEMEKLGIQSKICSLTTDNGSDIRLASQNKSKFGIRISCFLHILNLVVRNGLWFFDIPVKKSITTTSATNFTKSNTTASASNSTNSNATSVTYTDSLLEDNDYDSTIDVDKVSDEVSDDNASNISSEHNDLDKSSSTASTTISSLDNGSELSSLENDTSDDDINAPLLPSIIEEEEDKFLYQSYLDPTILLTKVHFILKRIRNLVTFIHRSSVLHRYVTKEIKLKIEKYNRTIAINDPTKKKIKFKEMTLDMKIRWSSTFAMLSRFLFYESVIISLTHDPSKRMNLTPRQYRKLKKLSFTSLDWAICRSLEAVLSPFNHSTKILSSRQRPNLSSNKAIMVALTNFLTTSDDDLLTLEVLFKKQLSIMFKFYLEKHVGDEQAKATLIASFLDPTTYRYLTCDDKKEAEAIISNEAMEHYAKINSRSLSSTNSSSLSNTSSNKNQPENQSNTLDNLFIACGLSVNIKTTTLTLKPSNIKEEIARYIATLNQYKTFSEYWDENQQQLPILSSIARRYNIMCATAIDCESAFSIAGFLQRKNRSNLAPSTLRYSMILREQKQT
ncbi:unnamed protein product, partial [Rotaria sp. Silwood1]